MKIETNLKTLYSYVPFGDFVKCCNCDKTMLLPVGEEICPCCNVVGCLAWVDEESQEMSSDALKGIYNVIDVKK